MIVSAFPSGGGSGGGGGQDIDGNWGQIASFSMNWSSNGDNFINKGITSDSTWLASFNKNEFKKYGYVRIRLTSIQVTGSVYKSTSEAVGISILGGVYSSNVVDSSASRILLDVQYAIPKSASSSSPVSLSSCYVSESGVAGEYWSSLERVIDPINRDLYGVRFSGVTSTLDTISLKGQLAYVGFCIDGDTFDTGKVAYIPSGVNVTISANAILEGY